MAKLSLRPVDPNKLSLRPVEPVQPSDPTGITGTKEMYSGSNIDKQAMQQTVSDPAVISMALSVNKELQKKDLNIGRTAGGIVGSVGLPALLNLIPPFAALPEEAITIPMAAAKFAKTVSPVLGAGIGGGIGETVEIASKEKRIATMGEILDSAKTEMLYEVGSRGLVHAGKFAFSPFIKKTAPKVAGLVDDYAKLGGVFEPSQLDDRVMLSVFDEISRGGFASRQVMKDLGEKNAIASRLYAEQMLDKMAEGTIRGSGEQIAKELAEGVNRPGGFIYKQIDDIVDNLYGRIDDLTEAQYKKVFQEVEVPSKILDSTGRNFTTTTKKVVGKELTSKLSPGFEELEQFIPVGVKTKRLKQFWMKLLQDNNKLTKYGQKPAAFTLTPEAIREGNKYIMQLEDVIPHKDMRKIRSKVLKDIRKFAREADQNEAITKRFEQVIFDTLTDPSSVKGATPEIQNLFNNTRNLYASLMNGLDTFPEKLMEKIEANQTQVAKTLFTNPTSTKEIRKTLLEPIQGVPSEKGKALFNNLRTRYISDLIEESSPDGIPNIKRLENLLFTKRKILEGLTPDPVGKKQLQNISDLYKVLNKKPAGGASLFIRGSQMTGAYMIWNGGKEGDFAQIGAGGTLLLGPYAFARLASNQIGSKLLTSGINLKPGSTSLVPITVRIVRLLRDMDIKEKMLIDREIKNKQWKELQPKMSKNYYRGFGGRGV